MSLVELVTSSDSKRHDLLTWVTLKFQEAVKWNQLSAGSEELSAALEIHEQMTLLIRFISDLEDFQDTESHYIWQRFSQLFAICLQNLEKIHPEKLFDSAELMVKILSEEDVSIEDENGDDDKQKKKKKKGNKKRTYTYSPAKDIASLVLIQLFEVFGNKFSSLVPFLFGAIFKNLKKMLEKSKYMHATFITSLMRLVNVMLRNGNQKEFAGNYFSKFSKISKNMFDALYSDEQDFPVDFVSAVIEIWSICFRQASFVKDHISDIPGAIFTKYGEGEIGSYGFTNDKTRPSTARSLAEILFDYYYVENLLDFRQIWVLYANIFKSSSTRDIQAGIFESIIHFIALCSATDITFFDGLKYLDIITVLAQEIFDVDNIKHDTMDELYKFLRYFDNMHEVLLPRIGDSSRTQILFQIMGSKNSSRSISSEESQSESSVNTNKERQWFNLAQLRLAKRLISLLSSSFGNEQIHIIQIKQKLIELSTCDIFSIRIHANETLKVFLTTFPEYLSETIESSLEFLSKNFNLTENFPFSVNHGHALIIANMIEATNKDYVSYELIMRITVFATSFIKNHTTSTSSTLYYKGLICWILLMGLVNYKDEQYLMMQSSQLFLFWKVLLTHSFGYHDEDELYRNLEIRNHSLTCLLTFIGNARMDRDLSKQISYLLIKCSNFNHSIALKSTSIDNALLVNEHRILQIYLRLHEYIKRDFNSSLLILIIKNFSDPNLYVESSHSILENIIPVGDKKSSIRENSKESSLADNTVSTILNLTDGFAFGISSKITMPKIQELSIKVPQKSDCEISGNWPSKEYCWHDIFEKEITKPITPVLSLDYLILLYGSGHYTAKDLYSPRITTSLIDASMEIFSLIFPYLNGKIQYSVIESLNVSMFSKLTSPLRSVSVAANVCTAINSTLNIISEQELSLDCSVGQLLIDSLKKIEFYNDSYLMKLKADCIGSTCLAVSRCDSEMESKEFVSNQCKIILKNVVDTEEPYKRIFYALSLVAIYRYNGQTVSFISIFEVIFALVQDPHPVVHTWSLKAMHILLDRHLSLDISTTARLLSTLESVLSGPSFGIYGSSILRYNYNRDFNSHLVISQIVKTLTETLGPNLAEIDQKSLNSYRNMTIGSLTSKDIMSQNLSLSIYEMLATFKLKGIVGDEAFMRTAKSMIEEGVTTKFGSTYGNCRFTGSSEIFSSDSSLLASFDCFGLFTQLLKLQKSSLITEDIDTVCWRYLDLHPFSKAITSFMSAWIEQGYELDERLFDKLYLFFNMSEKKLFQAIYQEYNCILLSKGYKKLKETEIHGEEEKAIAGMNGKNSFNLKEHTDSIHWASKTVTLDLIKVLCHKSQYDNALFKALSKKVPGLIKVSFQAAVSKVTSMRLLGLDILKILLKHYSKVFDPENPTHFILEFEEAQITSALMPAFDTNSDPNVIVSAINVCAEFLSSNVAPLERVNRVSRIMVSFLDVFNESNTQMKIGNAIIGTLKAKRKIELAILDAWSMVVQNALSSGNEKLVNFTRKYWEVLVPLWIISLREYVMVKYEKVEGETKIKEQSNASIYESRSTKMELYDGVWLNFAIALSSILEADKCLILNCLNEQEAESFMFILFTQCMEEISKNMDKKRVKMRILPALHNILKCRISFDNLFEDSINEELVGLLNRLIIMSSTDEREEIVNIINDLIGGYINRNNTHETFLPGIDKIYDLLRLLLIPVSELLPCIKYNTVEDKGNVGLKLDENSVCLLKHIFSVFETNVSKFEDIFKADLYACLLYMIGRIYEDDRRDVVVPLILPLLKSITFNLKMMGGCIDMISVFYESIKSFLFERLVEENKLATLLILIGNGFSGFSSADLILFVNILVKSLLNPETTAVAAQGLKNIVSRINEDPCCAFVLKSVIKQLPIKITEKVPEKVSSGIIEIVMAFTKKNVKENPDKSHQAFAVCLSIVMLCYENSCDNCDTIIIETILELMNVDSKTFKKTFDDCISEHQKKKIENIMKNTPQYGVEHLTLKSFM